MSPNIIGIRKSRKLKWPGHATRTGDDLTRPRKMKGKQKANGR